MKISRRVDDVNDTRPSFPPYDKTKYIKVVCRLCGSEWLYPKQYEQVFDAEHPLDNCAYCKRRPYECSK